MNNLLSINLPKKKQQKHIDGQRSFKSTSYKFKIYNKRWCTLVSGLLSLAYTLLEKGTIAYVPQRTTLTAKFH